jgi:hypothetical protein
MGLLRSAFSAQAFCSSPQASVTQRIKVGFIKARKLLKALFVHSSHRFLKTQVLGGPDRKKVALF